MWSEFANSRRAVRTELWFDRLPSAHICPWHLTSFGQTCGLDWVTCCTPPAPEWRDAGVEWRVAGTEWRVPSVEWRVSGAEWRVAGAEWHVAGAYLKTLIWKQSGWCCLQVWAIQRRGRVCGFWQFVLINKEQDKVKDRHVYQHHLHSHGVGVGGAEKQITVTETNIHTEDTNNSQTHNTSSHTNRHHLSFVDRKLDTKEGYLKKKPVIKK